MKVTLTTILITTLVAIPAYAVIGASNPFEKLAVMYAIIGALTYQVTQLMPYFSSVAEGTNATANNKAEWLREFSNDLPR